MKRKATIGPLNRQNAHIQAKLAVVLLSVIPVLSFFYLGSGMYGPEGDRLRDYEVGIVFACTLIAALSGYLILRKYPQNIINLRQYVTELAEGTLREQIQLDQTACSDDLLYIEEGFNTILKDMRNRLGLIEEKLKVEKQLRKALERQQQTLVQAERHRAMVQSIGAACHHLGQPATALRMHLFILKEQVQSLEEMEGIEQSIHDLDRICDILQRLREVSEFRTEPYICGDDLPEHEILAI